MNADRELLEAAARAAGYAINAFRQSERDELGFGQVGLWIPSESTCWNPLINDGHALRLACKLEFQILIVGEGMCEVKCPERNLAPVWEHVAGSDTASATRRAIVRAAAALAQAVDGKATP